MTAVKITLTVECETPEPHLARIIVGNLQNRIKDLLERSATGTQTCVVRNTTKTKIVECEVDGEPLSV